MRDILEKWLKIYKDEVTLFLWSALLLFLIRGSNIVFNNFAETAFLKRFGVEYLPYITAINSVVTFFIMGALTGVMARVPGSRLLSVTLAVCGCSVAALRFVIPLEIHLIYPLLYIMKTQYEALLAFMFWNLANDLYNTRQSKRIFPLITAGGILGGVVGSFGTPPLAKAIALDNLMWVYLMLSVAGAMVVRRMGSLYPSLLLMEGETGKKKTKASIVSEIKKVVPILRESKLTRILVLLTLLPNVMIPIMNYQFSFAVDQTFANEGGMLAFFGYFRGAQNVIALFLTLFVGRIYGRFGIPVALMFHPFNYMLAFLAFLFRFDIFSAMYARLSTAVLRNAVNNPARAVLMGLFPPSYRAVVRTFLRGTVVRVGVLFGSGLILLSQRTIEPRYLSVVALVFVFLWIGATISLKRSYPSILVDLIKEDMVDFKSLEEQDATQIFRDEKTRSQLLRTFMAVRGEGCLWYGRILKSMNIEGLDGYLLEKIKQEEDSVKVQLLPLLSPLAAKQVFEAFLDLADLKNPELLTALARTAKRFCSYISPEEQRAMFDRTSLPEVKAPFVIGLYRHSPETYGKVIDSWLSSPDLSERKAGIVSAGASADPAHTAKLKDMLQREEQAGTLSLILEALSDLDAPDLNPLVFPHFSHPEEAVRLIALKVVRIDTQEAARRVIGMMDDRSVRVHDLAVKRLQNAPYQEPGILVESLAIPSRGIREGIFKVVEALDIKDVDFFRFFRSQIREAYVNFALSEALRSLPDTKERNLLVEHHAQKKTLHVDNVLRAMAAKDKTGKMRTILRGIYSSDPRKRSNSLEAFESMVDSALSGLMTPLMEPLAPSESLVVGKKAFKLPEFQASQAPLYETLFEQDDWVSVSLALHLVRSLRPEDLSGEVRERLSDRTGLPLLGDTPGKVDEESSLAPGERMASTVTLTLSDRILCLKAIPLFEGLSVSELARIAMETAEAAYQTHEFILKPGDPLDAMFLVVWGKVGLLEEKDQQGRERELATMGAGEPIGLMTLFDETPEGLSLHALERTLVLVLRRSSFREIVKEYPEIVLPICKVMSARIRMLHDRLMRLGQKIPY